MNEKSTTIALRNTNIIIHVQQVKESTLFLEKWQGELGKTLVLECGACDVTSDSAEDDLSISCFVKVACYGCVLYS